MASNKQSDKMKESRAKLPYIKIVRDILATPKVSKAMFDPAIASLDTNDMAITANLSFLRSV